MDASLVNAALTNLLAELIDSAAPYGCWVINREELGLLGLRGAIRQLVAATQGQQS